MNFFIWRKDSFSFSGNWDFCVFVKFADFKILAAAFQIIQIIPEKYCPGLHLSIDQVWWLNELQF